MEPKIQIQIPEIRLYQEALCLLCMLVIIALPRGESDSQRARSLDLTSKQNIEIDLCVKWFFVVVD